MRSFGSMRVIVENPRLGTPEKNWGRTPFSVRPRVSTMSGLLFEQLDVAEMRRSVARPPDAVRVGRIELDASRIRLDDRQRELRPHSGCGIEAGDLVGRLLGHPDHLLPYIRDRDISTAALCRRFKVRELAGLLIDLHEHARLMEADPKIAIPICSHAARNVFARRRELVDLSGRRIQA